MRPRQILIILTGVLSLNTIARADEEYDQLKARHQAAMLKFHKEGDEVAEKVGWTKRSLPPTPEQSRAMQALRPVRDTPHLDFRDEFLAYAEKHKGHREAIEAWAMAATMSRRVMSDDGYMETAQTTISFERLRLDHASDPDIVLALDVIRRHGHGLRFDTLEAFYKAIEEKHKDHEIVARSRLARANMLTHSQMSRGPIWYRHATSEQKADDERAADELLRSLVREYPNTTAGKEAEGRLFRKEHLAQGRKLADFEGKDIGGNLIRLSQFRGRVVMMVFWASWCGPCMQRIPEEREMADKFADKQFTILGVNCDRTRGAFKKVMAKEALPWPNIFDGDPKTGPIVNALRINAFPTVILLDHEGIIRYQDLYGERLEKAISELVGKVPSSKGPSKSQPSELPRSIALPTP